MFHVKHFNYPLHIVSRETLRSFFTKNSRKYKKKYMRIVDRNAIILYNYTSEISKRRLIWERQ